MKELEVTMRLRNNRLKQRRLGMSQRQLAELIGVGTHTLCASGCSVGSSGRRRRRRVCRGVLRQMAVPGVRDPLSDWRWSMKVTTYEFRVPLACPEHAQREREPRGECPGAALFGMPTVQRRVAELTDEQIDEWVMSCPVHVPEDAHDHRWCYRIVLEGDAEMGPTVQEVRAIASSHYEGCFERTKDPRVFTERMVVVGKGRDDGREVVFSVPLVGGDGKADE